MTKQFNEFRSYSTYELHDALRAVKLSTAPEWQEHAKRIEAEIERRKTETREDTMFRALAYYTA